MEKLDLKNATPEQVKEIYKIVSKARAGLMFLFVKFFAGLFTANLAIVIVGNFFLKDINPENQLWFRFFASLINTIFLMKYLNNNLKIKNDGVASKIKEILNK